MHLSYKDTGRLPNRYRLEGLSVFFSDEGCLKVIEKVLDKEGKILNFPGTVPDERWEKKYNLGRHSDVRFEAQFHRIKGGNTLMLWMVQPSGWEWVDDDGFGFSGDSVIMLYSVIDAQGNFTEPFRLFSIDGERYCNEYDKYL